MTDLEKVKNWLLTYPDWDAGALSYIDYTDAVPGNTGLFPRGLEEVSRREDVLGNRMVKNRYHFALYRVTRQQARTGKDAAWLLDFQNWVQQQWAAGLAPRFGDVEAEERIRAEGGKLHKADAAGSATYVVTLTAEFTRRYDAGE